MNQLFDPGGNGASRTPQGNFTIGPKPYWILRVDGKTVWVSDAPPADQPADEWSEYRGAISRLDLDVGIDQVQTCTFDISGDDAAVIGKALFPRMAEIEVLKGYADYDNASEEPQRMFRGFVMQGFPSPMMPAIVEIHCDSPLYVARENWVSDTEEVADQVQHITAVLGELGLDVLAGDFQDLTQDEGGTTSGNVLAELERWSRDNGMHFVDTMDGKLHLVYPHSASPKFFDKDNRMWELARKGSPDRPDIAPILSQWAPEFNYVDAPRTIYAAWYDPRNPDDEVEIRTIEVENENGIEGTSLNLGIITAGTFEEAEALVKNWVGDYHWQSVTGDFQLLTGLPIMPFDLITPRNGPAGLEEFYDKAFAVIQVHSIFDSRGWQVRGKVRGTML